jgi:uncharacterized protein (TIGR01244 family)
VRKLDERTYVARQIALDDVGAVKAAGVTMIVNNRPDGEGPDQPTSAEMEAVAQAAGLGYRYIPVRGGFSPEQVEAMTAALDDAKGPVLAFCLSGTRSTFLWALARASQGEDGEELIAKAADAGYDLSAIAPYLRNSSPRT